jgi:hypothetical protein
VIARVLSIDASIPAARGGVTVRESLAGQSRHTTVALSRGNGYAFQRRSDPAGDTVLTDGGAGTAPGWVRLARTGDFFVAYRSADGRTWTRIGEDIIPMAETVYVGLVASSGSATAPVTAAIDSLSITSKAGPGNRPPAVSLLSPASGTEVMLPATVTISALASDPENRLLSVDFYADWTLISRITTAPYSVSWLPPAAGTYTLTAVAHDADGGSTTSSAVIVHAQPRPGTPAVVIVSTNATTAPPRASISTPAVSASTTVPASTKTTTPASASTTKPAGASTMTPAAASTTTPAAASTTPAAPGSTTTPTSTTTAAAANSTSPTPGGSTTTASGGTPAIWTVATATGQPAANKPPLVALTTYGTNFIAPATIRLTATAADPDGQVARVEFFSGTMRVHTDTTAPYTFAWSNVAAGTYSLTAVAFDNDGASASSAPVVLTVQKAPGTQADLSEITTRAHSPEAAPIEPAASALEWDDAIERVEFSSEATRPAAVTGAADDVAWADLTTGPHDPAAIPVPNESAPATPTRAFARVRKGPNTPPVASLMTDGTEFTAPARIVLTAVAWDADGPVARVELFAGKTRLSTVTSEPYTFTWSSVRAGSYDLTAVAYDQEGARATSLPVQVTVQPALPVITLTTSGTTFSAPATVRLTAGVTGSDSPPDRVEFFAGTTRLNTTVEAPYTFDWPDAAAGTYALTAVAVFDGDLTVTSAPVRVTVQPARSKSPAVSVTTDETISTAR